MQSCFGGRADTKAILAAFQQSFAVIEFDTKRVILSMNKNFCHAMGYRSREVAGRHHRIFVEPDYHAFRDRLPEVNLLWAISTYQ
ncbi:PAS domain S-box protein [Acetobacter aceti]|uniref:PAS domain S-box protein n=1 Tax=Acetobacter aceti TaxID=435 RepID=UPI0015E0F76A